jgi:antirestriction protein ArdC
MTTTTKARKARKPYDGPSAEEKLCSALVQLLEQGANPWRRDWAQIEQLGHHRNLITGAAYRGSNPAVLEMWAACRGYTLPLWLGVAQAKQQGWYPRKGSQGCYVVRPQLNKREQQDEQGKPVTGPDGTPLISAWVSYKPACVFNVQDLQGEGLEEAIAAAVGTVTVKPEPERLAAAEAVLGAWEVPTVWAGNRAFYRPSADQITMPTRAQFSTTEGLYATWAHEQAHSTGHSSRLNREMGGGHGSDSYAREELVAELAAFLICNRLEISSSTENHAAYLGHWARVLKEGPRVLFKALGQASAAANAICGPDVIDEA